MSKLRKVKLTNAITLKEEEMKQVCGGSLISGSIGDPMCRSICMCHDMNRQPVGSGTYISTKENCADNCRRQLGSNYGGYSC